MTLLLTTIAAGVVWIVLVSLGQKPFDSLLVGLLMILLAASYQVLAKYLPGRRRKDAGSGYIAR
jgi:hypothetical protein